MAQITRSNIAQIRKDVEAALATVYAKHGIDISVGRITFNESSFRCKIEGNVRSNGAAGPVTAKTAALGKVASALLGKNFDQAKTYTHPHIGHIKITGYNEKAFKYPFVITSISTNKAYKVSKEIAVRIVSCGAVA